MRTWLTFSLMATRSSRLAARAFLGEKRLRAARVAVKMVVLARLGMGSGEKLGGSSVNAFCFERGMSWSIRIVFRSLF